MADRVAGIRRAYELFSYGSFEHLAEVKLQLHAEGYDNCAAFDRGIAHGLALRRCYLQRHHGDLAAQRQ